MYKYMLKESQTDLIDCSTVSGKDYINGNVTFHLIKWNSHQKGKYFEESKATVKLSDLPLGLQISYANFVNGLIGHIKQFPND